MSFDNIGIGHSHSAQGSEISDNLFPNLPPLPKPIVGSIRSEYKEQRQGATKNWERLGTNADRKDILVHQVDEDGPDKIRHDDISYPS